MSIFTAHCRAYAYMHLLYNVDVDAIRRQLRRARPRHSTNVTKWSFLQGLFATVFAFKQLRVVSSGFAFVHRCGSKY